MDTSKLIRTELFLLKLYDGFQLDYRNNFVDFSLKILAFFSAFCVFVTELFMFHKIFLGKPNLEEFSDVIATFAATFEALLKIYVFLWSHKQKKLLDTMVEMSDSGLYLDQKEHFPSN